MINKIRHLLLEWLGKFLPWWCKKYFLLPAVCVLAVREDGKVLAVSRKNDPNAWGLPGGKVELNWYGRPIETIWEAAIRETLEETGLMIEMDPNLSLQDICPFYEDTAEDEFWTACFLVKVRGEIHTSETGRVAWVDWIQILNGPFGLYNKKVKALWHVRKRKIN